MNQQLLFNSSLALITTGIIFFIKGAFWLGIISIAIAIVTIIIWLMSGFFGKFEYTSPENNLEEEKEDEGKGVLKPF
mgnify:CR=1 FL=1